MTHAPLDEKACLAYDPWGWDETPYKLLSDRFVMVRKGHMCIVCRGRIRRGQRVRARREIDLDDRRIGTFYFCPSCCRAQARADRDEGNSIAYRSTLGAVRAGSLPRDALPLELARADQA